MIQNNYHGAVFRIVQRTGGDKVVAATTKLSEDQKKTVDALAEWEGKGVSTYIRDAVEFYMAFSPDTGAAYDSFQDVRIKMMENRDLISAMAGKMG